MGQKGFVRAVELQDGGVVSLVLPLPELDKNARHHRGGALVPCGIEADVAQRARGDLDDGRAAEIACVIPAGKLVAVALRYWKGQRLVGHAVGGAGVWRQLPAIEVVGDGELPGEFLNKGFNIDKSVTIGVVVPRRAKVCGGGFQKIAKTGVGDISVITQRQRRHARHNGGGIGCAKAARELIVVRGTVAKARDVAARRCDKN